MPKTDDGAGRPEYYTSSQLARIICWLADSGAREYPYAPDDVVDAIAWARALVTKENTGAD